MMRLAAHIIRLIDRFYLPPIDRLVSRQVFRYGVCGAANMAWNLVLYAAVYNLLLGRRMVDLGVVAVSAHVAALILVFPVTFFNGFWLKRHVAFRCSPLSGRTQLGRYALSVGGSLLVNYGCLKFLVETCGIWPTPSEALATVVTTVYSYLAARYFTFRNALRE